MPRHLHHVEIYWAGLEFETKAVIISHLRKTECTSEIALRADLLDLAVYDLRTLFFKFALSLSSFVGLDLRPLGTVDALVLSIMILLNHFPTASMQTP